MIDENIMGPRGSAKNITLADLPTYESLAGQLLVRFAGLEGGEHGNDTPMRFLKMLDELTACKDSSQEHVDNCIKWKMFPAEGDEMVVVRNITFTSLCNHHVVPFMGVAHIAYVPKNAVAGLSKFARVVRHFGRQLQVQERLTAEIADFLEGTLSPRGVGVVVEAEHLCMTIRGVHSPGTLTTTSAMRGVFSDHDRTAKAEFLNLIRG
jgi:GTP cyclohydrolase I